MPKKIGDMSTNYAEVYESWYDSASEICPECRGTGLDRDEIYDCETCFGEGVIVYAVGQPWDRPDDLDSYGGLDRSGEGV